MQDGIEALQTYTDGNMLLCRELHVFLKKRIQLEEELNHRTYKLVKHTLASLGELEHTVKPKYGGADYSEFYSGWIELLGAMSKNRSYHEDLIKHLSSEVSEKSLMELESQRKLVSQSFNVRFALRLQLKVQCEKQAKEFKQADSAERKARSKYLDSLQDLKDLSSRGKATPKAAEKEANLKKKTQGLWDEHQLACEMFNAINIKYFKTDLIDTFTRYEVFNSDMDFYCQMLLKHYGAVERSSRDVGNTNGECIASFSTLHDYKKIISAKIESIKASIAPVECRLMANESLSSSQTKLKATPNVKLPLSATDQDITAIISPSPNGRQSDAPSSAPPSVQALAASDSNGLKKIQSFGSAEQSSPVQQQQIIKPDLSKSLDLIKTPRIEELVLNCDSNVASLEPIGASGSNEAVTCDDGHVVDGDDEMAENEDGDELSGPSKENEMVALYDFVGEEDTELSFYAGEVLFVDKSGSKPSQERTSEWIWARNSEQNYGYVPSNYVEFSSPNSDNKQAAETPENDSASSKLISVDLQVVPAIYRNCIEVILKEGPTVEGVFRVSGSLRNCKELKKTYEKAGKVDLTDVPIYDVCTFLKMVVRETEAPIIPLHSLSLLVRIFKEESSKERLEQLQEYLAGLEHWQSSTIGYFLHLFQVLADNESVTKMNPQNIAKVFGPTLFCALPIDIANVLMDYILSKFEKLYVPMNVE